MNKTSHTTLLLALFLLTGLLSQQFLCGKNLDCRESIYGFELWIKAYPAKDSISVGDTVWLEVSSPTTLQDVRTGRMIDYSGAANLGTAIGIAECTSKDRINSEGIQFFKFSLQRGREVFRPDTIRYREYSFAESNQSYQFKLAIVPQKKGLYKLFVSNAANVYRTGDKCTKAGFSINFKDTDQHLYLNEMVFGVALPPGGGVYLFKVI